MGTLLTFARHIQSRAALVQSVEQRLLALQGQYESCFREVGAVRDHELAQLAAEISRRSGSLPFGLDAALAKARREVEAELDAKLANLRSQHDKLAAEAEKTRADSIRREDEVHKQNVDLDAQEEHLKARNEQLLRSIAAYNDRIKQLGSGFGFFANFFGMRSLQAERLRIDEEQRDVAARIEALRSQWASRDEQHSKKQKELHDTWTDLRTRASGLQAAIDHLQQTRPSVVTRSSLERVLFDHFPAINPDQAHGTALCPRCHAGNAPQQSFCRVCAQRIKPDRPDLEGSIPEIAELNHHHRRFSEGMRGCQELIGLLVGVRSGLEAFSRSVESMIENEGKYPLPKLAIDVPQECLTFEQRFEALAPMVQARANHPLELAKQARGAASALDERSLQGYFERMGQELSRQAKTQWG